MLLKESENGVCCFFFNDTATTEIYTLSLHDALPISGSIKKIEQNKNAYVLWLSTDPALMSLMIKKGSVAIDGISLTISDVKSNLFGVSLIPTTLAETNIADRKTGDLVNLEADIISKWINKRLDQILPKSGNLTIDKLRQQGFS